MALPVTISTSWLPVRNYYCGPWKAPNGAIYAFLFYDFPYNVAIYKCSDFDFPSGAFTEQDSSNRPSHTVTTPQGQATAYFSGTNVHVVHWNWTDGSDYYYYSRFDTSSDTWATTDNLIDSWDDKAEPTGAASSIVFREDDGGQDEYIVLYNGEQDKVIGTYYDRVDYARSTNGTSWTAGNAVDAGGSANYSGAVAVRGSAPDANGHVVHFAYGQPGSYPPLMRTLRYSSGWQLSTEISCATNSSNLQHVIGRGIYYLDGSTDRCCVPFSRHTDNAPGAWMVPEDSNGDADGTNDSDATIDSTYDVYYRNSTAVICMAVDHVSGKAYVMWGENVTDGEDLRRSDASSPWSSWAASTEEEAGTCERISCNVYPRNGQLRLAFLWEDNGTIKYDEVDITSETAPALTAGRFPDQNYYIGPEKV